MKGLVRVERLHHRFGEHKTLFFFGENMQVGIIHQILRYIIRKYTKFIQKPDIKNSIYRYQ